MSHPTDAAATPPSSDGGPRLPSGEVYLVFARAERGQPLAQVGLVRAASPGLAFVYARQQYTERHWDELCVVPRGAVYSVAATVRDRSLPDRPAGGDT